MKNKFLIILSALCAVTLGIVGCMTSKVVTTGPSGTSVTNTVVNQANLTLDCAVIQANAAVLTSLVIQKDPTAIPALKDATTAIAGLLTGANTNSTTQILGVLGQSSNTALANTLGPIVNDASSLEQSLLAKYGTGVAGQITIAITTAVDAGITAGLVGH